MVHNIVSLLQEVLEIVGVNNSLEKLPCEAWGYSEVVFRVELKIDFELSMRVVPGLFVEEVHVIVKQQ